jgi:GNAT superfamily N-acetyltransferase
MIRSARAEDVLSLRRLLVQLGYPKLNEKEVQDKINLYLQERYHLLVAEIDQEVVGFISLHWFAHFHSPGSIGRISAFCVDERFRSQGIGIKLLEAAEDFFKTRGCTKSR